MASWWARWLVVVVTSVCVPFATRADEPPAATSPPDAGASPAETAPAPPSIEDEEAAVLGAPEPSRPPQPRPPAAPPPGQRSRDLRPRAQRKTPTVAEEAPPAAYDAPAFVIELGTAGFVSGPLDGGLFLGGRLRNELVLGGSIDYSWSSQEFAAVNAGSTTSSTSTFLLGAGVRYPLVRTADRRVELTGLADASFAYTSGQAQQTNVPVGITLTSTTANVSANGFSLAIGPGLRFWVTEHLALGYAARLRLTYFSGDSGALGLTMATGATSPGTLTTLAFDGTFQIVGVF